MTNAWASLCLVVVILVGIVATLYGLSLLYRGFGGSTRRRSAIVAGVFFIAIGVASFWFAPVVAALAALDDPDLVLSSGAAGATGLLLTAIVPGLRFAIGDRSRGRRRCRRCWYDMTGIDRCPECGFEPNRPADLRRTRRRKANLVATVALMLVAASVWMIPQYQRGGWRALVPTPLIAIGMPWMPDALLYSAGSDVVDATLIGRYRDEKWTLLDRWLINWRAPAAIRRDPQRIRAIDDAVGDAIEFSEATWYRLIYDIAMSDDHLAHDLVGEVIRMRPIDEKGTYPITVPDTHRDGWIRQLDDPCLSLKLISIWAVANSEGGIDVLRPRLDAYLEAAPKAFDGRQQLGTGSFFIGMEYLNQILPRVSEEECIDIAARVPTYFRRYVLVGTRGRASARFDDLRRRWSMDDSSNVAWTAVRLRHESGAMSVDEILLLAAERNDPEFLFNIYTHASDEQDPENGKTWDIDRQTILDIILRTHDQTAAKLAVELDLWRDHDMSDHWQYMDKWSFRDLVNDTW
ncbi:MAG: hypothetical protein KDA28_16495 [Phycisphaerales bacterium]|nr:hypothetical protein [Phycisphaerales bacterium]